MHPILFHFGPAIVPSYGVLAAVAILAGLLLGQRTARQQGLDPARVWTASVFALFLSALAAKAVAVGMHWQAFREQPLQLLSMTALGGSGQGYVGLGVGLLVVIAYARHNRIALRAMLDCLAAPLLAAMAIESLGCLLAGSAFGMPSHAWWGIEFHTLYAMLWWGTPMGIPLVPVQIITAAADALLALFVYWMGNWGLRTGRLAGTALLGGGFAHFLLQFWRGDVDGLSWTHGVLTATQLVCLAMLAAAVWFWWDLPEWRVERASSAG
jgi:phosphatidylglycerol:prolipoprotein diacylglycerol transferase